jgi:hypothetical protein
VHVINESKSYLTGASRSFIDAKLAGGVDSFSLSEMTEKTGLSVVAAKNQLLRLKNAVTRVSPRQQYFLIIQPEHRSIGAPPVERWLDDYFKWLDRPYYLALQSAAGTFGSNQQAIQETQIITDIPRREMIIGRIRLRFFMKSGIKKTLTQQLPDAYAPLIVSTPESTAYDLIRYSHEIGGIERAAETITPMLPLIKAKELRSVLDAEDEVATAQRLGFVLETLGATVLSNMIKDWLPKVIQMVPISTRLGSDSSAPISRMWGIINNSRSFI